MAALRLDERVQVLPGGEDLSSGLRTVELAAVAPDRFHLARELIAYVHDEGRLDRILAIGERVENLVRTVRIAGGAIPGEAGEKAGIAAELRGHAVIGVPPDGKGKDDDPRPEMPDLLHQDFPRRLAVLEMCVGEARIPALAHTHHHAGLFRFLCPQRRAAARARLAFRQIEYRSRVPRVGRPDERAGTGELDVVPVRGDRQDIHGHGRVIYTARRALTRRVTNHPAAARISSGMATPDRAMPAATARTKFRQASRNASPISPTLPRPAMTGAASWTRTARLLVATWVRR